MFLRNYNTKGSNYQISSRSYHDRCTYMNFVNRHDFYSGHDYSLGKHLQNCSFRLHQHRETGDFLNFSHGLEDIRKEVDVFTKFSS